jgi:ferrous iron transport protein A
VRNLGQLAIGEAVRVSAIQGTDEISVRLMEMGLTPGAQVKLLGKAPMGDPLEFEVRGYRLSIRKAEAQRVSVEGEDVT